MDLKTRIGVRIREARQARGWSQQELAYQVGEAAGTRTLSNQRVGLWERGEELPSDDYFRALEQVLGVRLC